MSSRRTRYCSTRSRDGRRHLDEHGVLDVELAVGQQLAERAQPGADALGVVEPVDAEQHLAGVAERLADLRGAGDDLGSAGELLEVVDVDRDRERRRAHGPLVGQVDQLAVGLVTDPLADEPHEVLGAAGQLEADQVGAEQALEDLAAPGQLLEQLGRREGDVQEEADVEVGPELAQHLRDELELVVVHPDGGALRRPVGGVGGEPPVDRDVGVPPLPVELRLRHHVVVERPEGGVGEPLVEALDLLGRQGDRVELHAVVVERLQPALGAARPADPDAVVGPHDRLDRGDQAAGRRPPLRLAVGPGDAVDRQPVGDDHEVVRAPPHPRRVPARATPGGEASPPKRCPSHDRDRPVVSMGPASLGLRSSRGRGMHGGDCLRLDMWPWGATSLEFNGANDEKTSTYSRPAVRGRARGRHGAQWQRERRPGR